MMHKHSEEYKEMEHAMHMPSGHKMKKVKATKHKSTAKQKMSMLKTAQTVRKKFGSHKR
jgi:hypothetical protein